MIFKAFYACPESRRGHKIRRLQQLQAMAAVPLELEFKREIARFTNAKRKCFHFQWFYQKRFDL